MAQKRKSKASAPLDAIQLLMEDHKDVDQFFKQFEKLHEAGEDTNKGDRRRAAGADGAQHAREGAFLSRGAQACGRGSGRVARRGGSRAPERGSTPRGAEAAQAR